MNTRELTCQNDHLLSARAGQVKIRGALRPNRMLIEARLFLKLLSHDVTNYCVQMLRNRFCAHKLLLSLGGGGGAVERF